eukprot:CAMPEP_0167740224 /NCGR_PEP_ID=MMETSP0110_2-20121227/155_1 /TAXON_ID=629695 /ORGANISM="Gymnochlora sp., Strain CCMP2014" /LENGTH=466 /DNA_ID=CAMNT_0007624087 /DNA_START=230 /DNA_END=1630 /DNA_ORIENTATION=-
MSVNRSLKGQYEDGGRISSSLPPKSPYKHLWGDDSESQFSVGAFPGDARKAFLRTVLAFERHAEWQKALTLFGNMIALSSKPDTTIYTSLINSCYTHSVQDGSNVFSNPDSYQSQLCRAGGPLMKPMMMALRQIETSLSQSRPGGFRRLLKRLSKAHSWDAVLRSYINLKSSLKNEEMFGGMSVMHSVYRLLKKRADDMWKGEIPRDNKTFSPLVSGGILFGDYKRLRRALGRARGLKLAVCDEMYQTVIAGCNQCGDYWLGSEEFAHMIQDGIHISSKTYDIALTSMCKAQQWRRALEVSSLPQLRDVELLHDGYAHLITACGFVGQWERALSLFSRMKEDEERVALAPCALLTALYYSKQYRRVVEFGHKVLQGGEYYIDAKTKSIIERAQKKLRKAAFWMGAPPPHLTSDYGVEGEHPLLEEDDVSPALPFGYGNLERDQRAPLLYNSHNIQMDTPMGKSTEN